MRPERTKAGSEIELGRPYREADLDLPDADFDEEVEEAGLFSPSIRIDQRPDCRRACRSTARSAGE
jgi:hypothetical protein